LIVSLHARYPEQLVFQSRAQYRAIFSAASCATETEPTVIYPGLDIENMNFSLAPQKDLAWAGRISPEKGLLFAVRAAKAVGKKLKVAGLIQNEDYFRAALEEGAGIVDYVGFLSSEQLNQFFMQSAAMLQTQEWVEAFGIVTAEAQAAGTPVIAFNKG